MTKSSADPVCVAALEKLMVKHGLNGPAPDLGAPLRAGAVLDALQKQQAGGARGDETARFGDYELNGLTCELTNKATGTMMRLTEKEARILIKLASAKGAAVARAELLGHVWGYSEKIETHTLETHIYRLRQKIETDPAQPHILITEDDGYKLRQ